MTKLLFRTFTFFIAGTLLLAACSLSGGTPSADVGAQITQTMQAVATDAQATLSAAAPTAIVQIITATPGPTEVNVATATLLPTPTQLPTGTPAATQPPAATTAPIVAPTSAPSYPTAHLNQNTNCRLGPSTDYSIVFSGKAGADLQVVSKTDLSDYVIVNNPNKSGSTCWLWTQYATINGDISGLPVAVAPALPTSSRAYTVSFYKIETCGGSDPAFKVVNTGSSAWQSYTLVVKDRTEKSTQTTTNNVFDKRSGCSSIKSIDPLDPGETGFLYSDSFSWDLSGHSLRATITLCSHNDQGGVCMDQIVDFVP